MIDELIENEWSHEEKGQRPARMENLAARDLPCSRTLMKKKKFYYIVIEYLDSNNANSGAHAWIKFIMPFF